MTIRSPSEILNNMRRIQIEHMETVVEEVFNEFSMTEEDRDTFLNEIDRTSTCLFASLQIVFSSISTSEVHVIETLLDKHLNFIEAVDDFVESVPLGADVRTLDVKVIREQVDAIILGLDTAFAAVVDLVRSLEPKHE